MRADIVYCIDRYAEHGYSSHTRVPCGNTYPYLSALSGKLLAIIAVPPRELRHGLSDKRDIFFSLIVDFLPPPPTRKP
jgi:hypothetical protein